MTGDLRGGTGSESTGPIHQPSMKVFTVGLDEKGVKMDEKEKDVEKAPTGPPPPSPILVATPIASKRRGSLKGAVACCALFAFIILLVITITEISYHRQRDEAFFRLKWAELKQRMLGYDLIRSQIEQQNQQAMQARLQSASLLKNEDLERPPVVDERLAFSNRLNGEDRAAQEKEAIREESSTRFGGDDEPMDVRFAFLRAILEKLRERAQEAGLNGKMHVSVVELRRPDSMKNSMNPDSDAFKDGFGEFAAPNPLTGHRDREDRLPASDFYGPRWEHPSQFMPDTNQHWNSFGQNRDGDSPFFPRPWEDPSEDFSEDSSRPKMKITHHFSPENPSSPSRVETELYGNAGQQLLDSLLLRGSPMLPEAQPLSLDSTGSSFPRWESDNSQQPWMANQQQMSPIFAPQPFWSPPSQGPLMFPQGPMFNQGPMFPQGALSSAPFWAQPMRQMDAPFGVHRDDSSFSTWGSRMGERMGADIGEQFREGTPRLPFGAQELPRNNVIDVTPIEKNKQDDLQTLPWYVPKGFENEKPSWASDRDEVKEDKNIPLIFPHPSAAEEPIRVESEKVLPDSNKHTFDLVNAKTDEVSEGVNGDDGSKWRVNAWQKTQPDAAIESAPAEPVDASRSLLPERDSFDDVQHDHIQHDQPRDFTSNDDVDPSRVLFQVDEPHASP